MNSQRRDFMRFAGIGLGGSAVGALLPGSLTALPTPSAASLVAYDVRAYGAQGNGTTLDTHAINRTIEVAADSGGGTVIFPAGTYLSYSIHLKSNVTLYLGSGATVVAAPSPQDGPSQNAYDIAEPKQPWNAYQDYGHGHWRDSLIWGEDIENVVICGPGCIWGKGLVRGWDSERPLAQTPGVGSKSIALRNCRNVILRDFSILKGGWFGILATGVDNLTIDNLRIDTDRDGMDIDCCRNVRVTNCSINSPWDDAISPKSSAALGYARPTENLTISNCYVTGAFELGTMLDGTWKRRPVDQWRFGGIKFGTESMGGFRNVTVTGCVFEDCQGIGLYSVDGAIIEDIMMNSITMRNCSNIPLSLRLGSRMRSPAGTPVGSMQRISISNIVSSNSVSRFGGAGLINGIPNYRIRDVKIHDCYFEHKGSDAQIVIPETPAEDKSKYPEPGMFGPIPAAGFFMRNIENLEFTNVEIACAQPDPRPILWLGNVEGADFFRVKSSRQRVAPMFDLHSVRDFRAMACTNVSDASLEDVRQKSI
jgi:polygalacturonase